MDGTIREDIIVSRGYSKHTFAHFLLINIISFGWVFALPIMVEHIGTLFEGNSFFFKLVLISTITGLCTSVFFGRLLDRTSSRAVLVIGLILNLAFWLVMPFINNFLLMCLAFIVEGAAFSALMIARAPYFYEMITELKSEGDYGRLESDTKMGMLSVLFLCLLGSGYLYETNPALPFLLNALVVSVALFMMVRYAAIKLRPSLSEAPAKNNIARDLKHIYKQKRPLFWLATTEGVFGALAPYLFVIVNVHLLDSGASVVFVSYLIATVYLFRILGAYLVRNRVNPAVMAFVLAAYAALVASMSLSSVAVITGVLFLVSSVLREYIEIYLVADVTRKSPEHLKGTVRSYSEIVSNAAIIVVMLVMSFYVDSMASGFWVLVYGLLFGGSAFMFYLSTKASKKTPDSFV